MCQLQTGLEVVLGWFFLKLLLFLQVWKALLLAAGLVIHISYGAKSPNASGKGAGLTWLL